MSVRSTLPRKRKIRDIEESVKAVRKIPGTGVGDDGTQSRIFQLESQVSESRRHYNNIATLLSISQSSDEQNEDDIAAAVSLCRVFCRLMASGNMLVTKRSATDAEGMIIRWLEERYDDYLEVLLNMLKGSSTRQVSYSSFEIAYHSLKNFVQSTALTLLMRLVKDEGSCSKARQEHSFPTRRYSKILRTILELPSTSQAREELVQKYINGYDDVRFYTFGIIHELSAETRCSELLQTFISNTLSVLSSIQAESPSGNDVDKFYITPPSKKKNQHYSTTAYRKRVQQAWLALFRLGLSKKQRKIVLGLVSSRIAPYFLKAELLMDFLTDSFNVGGSTSLLALSGLYYLIQEKNLDYPMFYQKLYSLLDAGVLHSRQRSRFFRLLDTFLASTHLPAALVASFIKKLSRLSLQAPPAGIVVVVPWIYNLLKRHPTCTFMVHREIHGKARSEQLRNEGMDDPFNPNEEDPMETDAISSSLWEIEMLQSHYHPNVATLARVISEQFTKQAYNMEDFLDHSYATMLDMEFSKDIKKQPVVEYEIPKKVFTGEDGTEAVSDDRLVMKLWDFS
ncbi:hypothetical protein GP486_001675 [Trichoglossum hirsutum]|uniref:CCAAT-binding factor domain-containing protein n=1 Tax=Trichoglossum hirsutum TaxID=265104 RepID=A0A9P8LG87_9PEZI|nr:hypothetical protein GP486_001675 [Trichoglossum hirsutum]